MKTSSIAANSKRVQPCEAVPRPATPEPTPAMQALSAPIIEVLTNLYAW